MSSGFWAGWEEWQMTVEGHIQTAREFLLAADREFESGDRLQASEKLWGAASHAVLAASQFNGWPGGRHYALKQAAERLATEHDDPLIGYGFEVAEKLHGNFYHDFMEEFELESARPRVRDFVTRVLALSV